MKLIIFHCSVFVFLLGLNVSRKTTLLTDTDFWILLMQGMLVASSLTYKFGKIKGWFKNENK